MTTPQLKKFTREEVEKHNKPDDLWIIVDSKVYNLTRFKDLHPGGISVLLDPETAGQDATESFFGLHRHDVLLKPQYKRLQIGVIDGEKEKIKQPISGGLSRIPYAEPTWLIEGYHTPYYKKSHHELQKAMRKFIEQVVYEDAQSRESDGKRPSQFVFDKMAEVELHAMRVGPGKHLKGRVLFNGVVTPEEFDYFHELIINQEIIRMSTRGYADGLLGGKLIGLPPVLNFGSSELKEKVIPDVLAGKKIICLAISEAHTGSDVFGLHTTAKKTDDGKYWIVNGNKKWITNGTFADYFTTGCKTDNGFTVLLIPRCEGLETKPIKTAYSSAAGTAYVTFDNVKVPIENTIGEEGGGIYVILSNFNHERWVLCCASARSQRLIIEECLKWASQRKVFGKPLINQGAVRAKIAAMIQRCEAVQSWLENITHQMCNMAYKEQAEKLAGQIAFLKSYCTHAAQQTAQDAVQIFGGRGVTQSGMGRFIEHMYRTAPFDALLGGAEDVLVDFGLRQALRSMPKDERL